MELKFCQKLIEAIVSETVLVSMARMSLSALPSTNPFDPVRSLEAVFCNVCSTLDLTFHDPEGWFELFPEVTAVRLQLSDFEADVRVDLQKILDDEKNVLFENVLRIGTPWKPMRKYYNFKYNRELTDLFVETRIKERGCQTLRNVLLSTIVFGMVFDAYTSNAPIAVFYARLALERSAADLLRCVNCIVSRASSKTMNKIDRANKLTKFISAVHISAHIKFDQVANRYVWTGNDVVDEVIDAEAEIPRRSAHCRNRNGSETHISNAHFVVGAFASMAMRNRSARQEKLETQPPESDRMTLVMCNELYKLKTELVEWEHYNETLLRIRDLSTACQQCLIWFSKVV